jgi:hypothetical protein
MTTTAGDTGGMQQAQIAISDAVASFTSIQAHVTSVRDTSVSVHQSYGADALRAALDGWVQTLGNGKNRYNHAADIMGLDIKNYADMTESDRVNAQRLIALLNKNS